VLDDVCACASKGENASRQAADNSCFRTVGYLTSSNPAFAMERALDETHNLLLSTAMAEQTALHHRLRALERVTSSPQQSFSSKVVDFSRLDYGTTAVVCVANEQGLHVANVGDSRCLIFRRKPTEPSSVDSASSQSCSSSSSSSSPPPSSLRRSQRFPKSAPDSSFYEIDQVTRDHNPTEWPDERQRVMRAGGSLVSVANELRIFPGDLSHEEAKRQGLVVNLSRALGHSVLSQFGISPKPDIFFSKLDWLQETFVLVASDGLFHIMSNEEVCDIVAQEATASDACSALIKEADRRWCQTPAGDNITVVLVRFGSASSTEHSE